MKKLVWVLVDLNLDSDIKDCGFRLRLEDSGLRLRLEHVQPVHVNKKNGTIKH